MALPRLQLANPDSRDIARVLRGALRLRTEVVTLASPPSGSGQHLLDLDIPGVGSVSVLAEPAGAPRADGGYPLTIRPVTRVQMAELFTMIERLDEPSRSIPPPPSGGDEEGVPPPSLDENTMVDARDPFTRVQPMPTYTTIGAHDPIPPDHPLDELIEVVEEAAVSSDYEISASSLIGTTAATPDAKRGSSSIKQVDKRVGRVLAGKYYIDAPIGAGAAATVYRATHKDLHRAVAVKILHAENQGDSQFIRRFKAEALTASKLEHVNVTRIIDFGAESGELYLVMELVTGRSLDATVAVQGPLRARRVLDVGIQVCRALTFAHGQGVIHRDIKPENIMLVADTDDDGEACDLVKVCDFGLAKMREPVDGGVEMTTAGMLCGSPAYMSPEQTRGDAVDARTDIYSLGVSMFEAMTGTLPYEAFSIGELFVKKCTQEPRRVSAVVPDVDPVVDDIVARAMSIDPSARHASARELRTELRAAREQLDDDGAPATLLGG